MKQSAKINELAKALAAAQSKIEGAVKDKSNPAFRSKYADLGACWDAIREPLSSNGLSVVQFPRTLDGAVEVETMLLHASGQFIADVFAIPVSKRDAHGYMSAVTYARRGSLMAVCGIAPIDDDGVGAVGKPGEGANPPKFAQATMADIKGEMDREAGYVQPSQYNVDKAKKEAAKNGNGNGKAEQWTMDAIAAIGKLSSERAIGDWWGEHGATIDKLEREYPALYDRLTIAADARRDQVPSVLNAG